MLHKMLNFKHGIDFSSVRRPTLFPTLFLEEQGIPCSKRNQFKLELIPKLGIKSWNQVQNSYLFKNSPSGWLPFPSARGAVHVQRAVAPAPHPLPAGGAGPRAHPSVCSQGSPLKSQEVSFIFFTYCRYIQHRISNLPKAFSLSIIRRLWKKDSN